MTDLKEAFNMVKDKFSSIEESVKVLSAEIQGQEELERAKFAFGFLMEQSRAWEIRNIAVKEKAVTLDEALKAKSFKSEEEKNLFCKVFTLRNKPKEVEIIPFPIKNMKRVVINGKPYIRFDEEGRGFVFSDPK